jgi:hypothetical protein
VRVTGRETALAFVTITVALFGGTFLMARSRFSQWQELRAKQDRLEREIRADRELISRRDEWEAEFAQVRQLLPAQPPDRKMDIFWLTVIDRLAAKHDVKITKIEASDEERLGDVYELPIECKTWEASLDSIVRFLFDLQSQGAMLDIRQLFVRSKDGGKLRGRLTLFCAYRREENATE